MQSKERISEVSTGVSLIYLNTVVICNCGKMLPLASEAPVLTFSVSIIITHLIIVVAVPLDLNATPSI